MTREEEIVIELQANDQKAIRAMLEKMATGGDDSFIKGWYDLNESLREELKSIRGGS